MKIHTTRLSTAGFTLIELMLSLVLVVSLLGMAFALMTGMLKLGSQLSQETRTWMMEQENQHFINQGFEQLSNEATLNLYQTSSSTLSNNSASQQMLVIQAESSNWGLNEQTNRAQTTIFEVRQSADGLLSLWLVFYEEAIMNFSTMDALLTELDNQEKLMEFPLVDSLYSLQWKAAINRLKDDELEFFPEYLIPDPDQRPSILSLTIQQTLDHAEQEYVFAID